MRRYTIEQKFKSAAAFLVILILLPYIVSVFVNGVDPKAAKNEIFYVRVKASDEEADGIAEVEWNEYITGVLAKDVPVDTEPEALKAQAVLVRTQISRALQENNQAEGQPSDQTEGQQPDQAEEQQPDQTEDQQPDQTEEQSPDQTEDKNGSVSDVILEIDYLSQKEMQDQWTAEQYKERYKKYRDAVEATKNEVLFYNDTYAWTPFHQSNAGMSRSAEEVMGSSDFPYIKVKECPADKEAEAEIGVFTFSYAEIQEKCRYFLAAETDGEKAAAGYAFEDFEILEYDSAGYVGQLRIGETICTGDQFRDALSLPSSSFSFSESGKKIKITTAGNGHGMGLSCWTANEMAKEGKTYKEILGFFYEGTKIEQDLRSVAKNK